MSNALDTKVVPPLWIGAGKAAGNAFLGVPGAGFELLGNLAGGYTEPTDEQLRNRAELHRQTNEFLGLPADFLASSPYPQSRNVLQRLGTFLLDANKTLQDKINLAREDFIGDNENLYTRSLEGLGAMSIPLLFSWVAGSPVSSLAAKGLVEAGTETGDFANEVHKQGQFNREAGQVALKNFLTNLGLNTGLSILPSGNEILMRINRLRKWGDLERIIMNIGKEVFEEAAIQEPLQRIINEASHENLDGQGNFAPNVIGGLSEYPNKVRDVMTGRK